VSQPTRGSHPQWVGHPPKPCASGRFPVPDVMASCPPTEGWMSYFEISYYRIGRICQSRCDCRLLFSQFFPDYSGGVTVEASEVR
jgi:hypothetical protein